MRTFTSVQARDEWLETQGDEPEPYELRLTTAEPLSTPILPPWDLYKDKAVLVAFPNKCRIEQGPNVQIQQQIDLLMPGTTVPLRAFDPEKGGWKSISTLLLDPNWDHDFVDWSSASIQRLIDGVPVTVDIVKVFKHMVANLRYFLDLPDERAFEFLALWAIGTFFRPVWDAYGYLHFDSAEEACGKTKAGQALGKMCFWPVSMSGVSTIPEWRDTSHFGRTQIIDDLDTSPEVLRRHGTLQLLYSGYKRGTLVRLKDKNASGFTSKVINPFTSRIIAAVWDMPAMLRSRTFRLMMQRTDNEELTQRWNPLHDYQVIRDELYTYAFLNMLEVKKVYQSTAVNQMSGRGHEIARPILTLALLLEQAGAKELHARTLDFLQTMDVDSLIDRAQNNELLAIMEAVLCIGEVVTAAEVKAKMPFDSTLSDVQIGRMLAGMSWTQRFVRQGKPMYRIDTDLLRKAMGWVN